MTEVLINAAGDDDLIRKLQGWDISVGDQNERPISEQKEIWIVFHTLATLIKEDFFGCPVTVTKRERPDFLLTMPKERIGIEVTAASHNGFEELKAIADKNTNDNLLDIGHFKYDSPKLSKKQKHAILDQENISSSGWVGNAPEREWAQFISDRIQIKLKKLESPTFEKFERNFLVVYDNLPLPNVDLDEALQILIPNVHECWRLPIHFEEICVLSDRSFVRIFEAEYRIFAVNDLWRNQSD